MRIDPFTASSFSIYNLTSDDTCFGGKVLFVTFQSCRLRMALSEFTIIKFLGKGSYGSVYKVLRKSDGKEYALKEVKIRYMSQQER